jgi:ligand-binding sensor domain-containing protein
MRFNYLSFVLPVAVWLSGQLPSTPGTGADDGGSFHVGRYGDIRALCRVGDSLWVGTGGGVFVYDLGSSEMAGHLTIGKGLPSNSVRAISVRGDTVFVGTDDGLSLLRPDTAIAYTDASPGPLAGAPLGLIRRVDFGLDDVVYLSTYGRGLGVVGPDTAWVITREDSLLDDKVFGMVQEDDTIFYYATSTGLCAYRDSLWVSFRAGAGLPRAEIRQIERAPQGGYYLVVGRRGIYRFDGERARRITRPDLFPENAVAAIAVDVAGGLWGCGSHGEVAVYRNGHWTELGSSANNYGTRRWRSAAADEWGGVFFGSADGLVLWVRDEIATEIRMPAGLPSDGVQAMTADSAGVVYALNGSYLLRIDKELESLTVERTSPVVVGLAVSREGVLWTATRWGIYRRDGERYVSVDTRLAEVRPVFSAIGFDGRGWLWVGTQAGNVHRFDGTVWMRMADAQELNLGAIRAFDADGRGRLWVTGSNGGVAVYQFGRWTGYGPPAYGDRPARQMAVAPDGAPVLATDAGLWSLDEDDAWKALARRRRAGDADSSRAVVWDPGLPAILSLDFDPAGRLFVGTENGIAAIDQSGMQWITHEDGIGGLAVTSVLARGGDDLWIGFRSDGLTRLMIAPSTDGPEQD